MNRLAIAALSLPLWVIAGSAAVAAASYARGDTAPPAEPDRVVGVMTECRPQADYDTSIQFGTIICADGLERRTTVTVKTSAGTFATFSIDAPPKAARVAVGDVWPPVAH